MMITTFAVEGPVLAAGIAMPRPADIPMTPYPWDEFLDDMRKVLDGYSASGIDALDAAGMVRHMTDDGTCYWIRADMDDGTRYLRVFDRSRGVGEMSMAIESCSARDVPGRIRLN